MTYNKDFSHVMAALRITNTCLFMQDKVSGRSLLFSYVDLVANVSVLACTDILMTVTIV